MVVSAGTAATAATTCARICDELFLMANVVASVIVIVAVVVIAVAVVVIADVAVAVVDVVVVAVEWPSAAPSRKNGTHS